MSYIYPPAPALPVTPVASPPSGQALTFAIFGLVVLALLTRNAK